uniref:Uncharacterized protein n=1 Tax=Photinus pyralis TaxID=7054 RepID=A0A1Y1MTP5_PHOPY
MRKRIKRHYSSSVCSKRTSDASLVAMVHCPRQDLEHETIGQNIPISLPTWRAGADGEKRKGKKCCNPCIQGMTTYVLHAALLFSPARSPPISQIVASLPLPCPPRSNLETLSPACAALAHQITHHFAQPHVPLVLALPTHFPQNWLKRLHLLNNSQQCRFS